MNNTSKIILVIALALSAMSCTKRFAEFNKDPHNASAEDMVIDDKMSGSLFQQIQRSVFIYRDGTYLDSDYQIMYNLCADTWCGYFAPTLGDGDNTSSFSAGKDGWTRSTFVNKFTYGMGAYIKLSAFAKENKLPVVTAIADVLKVATMHQVTDYYGPIPYTEAGAITPKYDTQEEIYKAFFNELDAAIETLESAGSVPVMPKFDLVYQGDIAKWIKFANSLRLRLAMRVVYADAALAKAEAEKSISSIYGVIEDNGGNAYIHGLDHHPVYEINVNFNDADTQIGASLDCYLNGYNDPRGAMICKAAKDGKIHGVRPGIAVTEWAPYKNPANNVSAPNSTIYNLMWLNAAEVAFLRAEGAARGWNMGGSAKDFYEKGIALSFEEWGVQGAAAYAANNTAVPAAFVDVVGSAGAPAPSTVKIAYNASANLESQLAQIGTQKWIALFPNGAEAWAEYRRLHYPALVTPAQNKSNGAVDTNKQIRRVNYPTSEQTQNAAGYASGLAALGGPDNGGTRLWWDQKPF